MRRKMERDKTVGGGVVEGTVAIWAVVGGAMGDDTDVADVDAAKVVEVGVSVIFAGTTRLRCD
jgi:hypothetical protein